MTCFSFAALLHGLVFTLTQGRIDGLLVRLFAHWQSSTLMPIQCRPEYPKWHRADRQGVPLLSVFYAFIDMKVADSWT